MCASKEKIRAVRVVGFGKRESDAKKTEKRVCSELFLLPTGAAAANDFLLSTAGLDLISVLAVADRLLLFSLLGLCSFCRSPAMQRNSNC